MKLKLLIVALLLLPSFAFADETINFQSGPATDANGYGQVALEKFIGQNAPFTTTSTWTDAHFSIELAKSNSPTNNSVFTIWSSVAGTPTTLLYTADTLIDNSTLTTTCTAKDIYFSGMTLTAGDYFIAFGVDASLSNTNKPTVCTDDSQHYWDTGSTPSTWVNRAFNFGGQIGSVTFSNAGGGGGTAASFISALVKAFWIF